MSLPIARHGAPLFTLRSENWNERLGSVPAEQVAVVAAEGRGPLRPVTLKKVLQEPGAMVVEVMI